MPERTWMRVKVRLPVSQAVLVKKMVVAPRRPPTDLFVKKCTMFAAGRHPAADQFWIGRMATQPLANGSGAVSSEEDRR